MSISQMMIAGSNSGSTSSPPYYYLGLSGTYSEGNSLSLYLDHANANGATVYWTISSDSASEGADYTTTSGNYSGSSSPSGNGSITIDYVNYIADNLTEGTEWFYLKLGTYPGGNDIGQWSNNINDTSTTPPPPPATADITWSPSGSINEGDITTATVATTNIDNGTTMYWWKKGGSIVAADLAGNATSGTFTVNSNSGTFTISPRADHFTEGSEYIQIAVGTIYNTELTWSTVTVYDTSTLGATMVLISPSGVPSPAIDGAVWQAGDTNGGDVSGIVHGSWTRDNSYFGGITNSGGNTWIEFPVRVTRTSFTIEMIADLDDQGGWQSLWDTGSMNESGVGYTCYFVGGQIVISTNYGTGSAGLVAFTCSGTDLGTLSHWVFVVNFASGEACEIYRNNVALTKVASTAVAPLDYGTQNIMVNARRGPSYNPTDYGHGTIYTFIASPGTYSAGDVASSYNSKRAAYGNAF